MNKQASARWIDGQSSVDCLFPHVMVSCHGVYWWNSVSNFNSMITSQLHARMSYVVAVYD